MNVYLIMNVQMVGEKWFTGLATVNGADGGREVVYRASNCEWCRWWASKKWFTGLHLLCFFFSIKIMEERGREVAYNARGVLLVV